METSFRSFCDKHNKENGVGLQSAFRNGVKCAILNLDCSGGYAFDNELNRAWICGFEIATKFIGNGLIITPPRCPGIPLETPTKESYDRFETAKCYECGKAGDPHLLWSLFCEVHCNAEECQGHYYESVESRERFNDDLKTTIAEAKVMRQVDTDIEFTSDAFFLASLLIRKD